MDGRIQIRPIYTKIKIHQVTRRILVKSVSQLCAVYCIKKATRITNYLKKPKKIPSFPLNFKPCQRTLTLFIRPPHNLHKKSPLETKIRARRKNMYPRYRTKKHPSSQKKSFLTARKVVQGKLPFFYQMLFLWYFQWLSKTASRKFAQLNSWMKLFRGLLTTN